LFKKERPLKKLFFKSIEIKILIRGDILSDKNSKIQVIDSIWLHQISFPLVGLVIYENVLSERHLVMGLGAGGDKNQDEFRIIATGHKLNPMDFKNFLEKGEGKWNLTSK